jgi:PAS domain S-box-containing protein
VLINDAGATLADAVADPAPPPGTSADPAGHRADPPSRSGPVLDAVTRAAGLVCAAIGVTVLVAWLARATVILQFGSHNAMSANTALAVVVTGVALVAVTGGIPRAAQVAGVFDLALGGLVLIEYALGRNLGIDQLVLHPYLTEPHALPGRLAFSTAVCVTLAGAALLAWGPWRGRRRPTTLAVAGSLIAGIAVVASFGYATGTPAGYGWGHLTAMSLTTAVALLFLSVGLLSAAWRDTRPGHGTLPGWLPMPVGVLALGLASTVWLTIAAGGPVTAGTVTGAATVLGLFLASLVMLVVWLAQHAHQADGRRQVAVAESARQAGAELAARESEQRLFQFLDFMPVAVFIALPGGQPYYANDEAERVLGRGVVPGVGGAELAETYHVFQSGTDRPYPIQQLAINRAAQGTTSHTDDMEIRKPDSAVIPLEVWGRPVYGPDGEVIYALAAFADVSDRRARQRTIASQAALLELAHDAIFVQDLDGRVTYWNAGAQRTYGFTRAEAMGRLCHDLLGTEYPEPLTSIETTMARHGLWEGELVHRRADGRSIVVESRWAAQLAPGGSLLGYMEVNRDITARKDAEREALRVAAEVQALNATLGQRVRQRTVHLEQANKNLEAFTYSVAHDLRTPLRGISGFAEALRDDYGDLLDAPGRDYADRVQAGCAQMGALIDDLLQLLRVTQAEMNLQDVDLSAEVNAVCGLLRARDLGRQVRVLVQDGVRATADRSLIRAALENLLGNAWKFTAGRADATIEFGTAVVDGAPVCCYVRDNGAGFDPAYVGQLFQPFQRLHDAREFPGTGIGLASVQRIVQRHGGRTWAEGAVGRGATIYFTLDANEVS